MGIWRKSMESPLLSRRGPRSPHLIASAALFAQFCWFNLFFSLLDETLWSEPKETATTTTTTGTTTTTTWPWMQNMMLDEKTLLGRGATFTVHLGRIQNEEYAVKVFHEEKMFQEEADRLKLLSKSSNILTPKGQGSHQNRCYLAFERMESLDKWLMQQQQHQHQGVTELMALRCAENVATGMRTLVSAGEQSWLKHGRLKCENVFVDGSCCFWIGDLGSLHKAEDAGTTFYAAPEMRSEGGQLPDVKCNVWSFGVILLQVCWSVAKKEFVSAGELWRKAGWSGKEESLTEFLVMGKHANLLDVLRNQSCKLSGLLANVLSKCLEADTKKRYETWDTLLEDLNPAICESGKRLLEQRLLDLKEGLRKLYGRNIDHHRMLEKRLFLENVLLEPHVVRWQSKSDLSSTRRLNLPQADILANKGHIALWGTAGSGKSSLCRWIAWEWSIGRLKEAEWQMFAELSGASKSTPCQWMAWEWSLGRLKDVEWPIYVDLPGAIELLVKGSDGKGADQHRKWSLFDLLNAYWRETKVISENADENEAELLVEAMGDKWMLVLDGLDEARLKSDSRVATLLDKVRDASWNDVAKAKIVILAGRPPERKEDSVAGRWTELEMVGVGEEQRRKYVANVFTDRSRLARAVTRELLETGSLNDLACIPLQLQMICLARRYGSVEEFEGLADLFSKTLDLCLRREVYLKEREAATAEDEKTIARLLKTLEDLAGEKDGMTVEEMDVQLVSRSGIVFRSYELSEEDRKRARIANVKDSVDKMRTWKWYHSSFKDFYQSRQAVRLVEELGKDASDWDRAMCFHKALGKANVLCCRMAMWVAKEAERKNDTELFRSCFWGWLIIPTTKVFDYGILQCKELEGWKEAALSLCHVNSDGLDHAMFYNALYKGGQCLYQFGCWNDALKMYEKCRELEERVLGPEHPDYLTTLQSIAGVYKSKGQLDEALKRYEECRCLRLKVLGPEHPDYLLTLFSIGGVYDSKGQYDEALKMYEECRCLRLKVLGAEHPDYLATLHKIAMVYNSKGQYDEALKLFDECRCLQLKVLGPEHPDYLMTLSNIASVCKSKGQFDKALKLNEECRCLRLKVLGPEHPDYLTTLQSIAGVYKSKGQLDEALKRYEECRCLRLKVLGPEHPDYLLTLFSIGALYAKQIDFVSALPLLRDCVARGRKIKFHRVEEWAKTLKLVEENVNLQKPKQEFLEKQVNLQKPKQAGKKIGPNDSCPCKSGKKYKKCCKNKK